MNENKNPLNLLILENKRKIKTNKEKYPIIPSMGYLQPNYYDFKIRKKKNIEWKEQIFKNSYITKYHSKYCMSLI